MSDIKTKEEIIATCEKEFKDKGPDNFYTAGCVNWKGRLKTKEPYTEIIAEFILKKYKLGKFKIEKSSTKNYKVENHDGEIKNEKSNRYEEIIAKDIFNQFRDNPNEEFGKIIDYQVPLKEKQTDKKGKIDLLAYNEKTKTATVLELKKQETTETLLRCVLECYTYKEQLRLDNLKNSFKSLLGCEKIKAASLIFIDEKSRPYIEYKDLCNRKNLKELMKKLEIESYFIVSKQYKIFSII